jgi:hypothetical protein
MRDDDFYPELRLSFWTTLAILFGGGALVELLLRGLV